MNIQEMKQNKEIKSRIVRVAFSATYYDEVIEGITNLAAIGKKQFDNHLNEEIKKINNDPTLSADDKNFIEMQISDDHSISESTIEIVKEAQIFVFYKIIENNITAMLKSSKLFSNNKLNKSYTINGIEVMIPNLKSLSGFDSYNYLRLLNNCIKHNNSNIDNQELATFEGKQLGKPLKDLDKKYYQLRDGVSKFIESLKNEIINQIKLENE